MSLLENKALPFACKLDARHPEARMNQHYSTTRKIDPTRGAKLPDGSPNDMNRVEIGPTQLAFAEWETAGLTLPDLPAMRAFRLRRLVDALAQRGWGGILMFDPLNIRYATDSTNMQLWNAHNPFRACLVCADGHMVLWDYKNAPFLAEHNPLVADIRSGSVVHAVVDQLLGRPVVDVEILAPLVDATEPTIQKALSRLVDRRILSPAPSTTQTSTLRFVAHDIVKALNSFTSRSINPFGRH